MQFSQTTQFLHEYKRLVQQLERARTAVELVDLLCTSSGGKIMPGILFAATGHLKPFDTLRDIAYDQLRLLVKPDSSNPSISFLLLANIKQNKKLLREWLLPAQRRDDDSQWFSQTFGTDPVSCVVVRQVLLQQPMNDLRFYLTATREPRSDLSLVLSQLRVQWQQQQPLVQ